MASQARASRRPTGREAQTLRRLEVRLLGISRAFGENLALATPLRAPPARRRLAFQPVTTPLPFERAAGRLRFAPLPPAPDRLVVTNWDAEPGLVCLGDVELELEPGQSATLWVNRSSPTPHTEPLYGEQPTRGPAFAFADSAPLV
jgi:hypothetical protein